MTQPSGTPGLTGTRSSAVDAAKKPEITTLKQLNDRLRTDYAAFTRELGKLSVQTTKSPADVAQVEQLKGALTQINHLRLAMGEYPFQMKVGESGQLLEKIEWRPVEE